MNKTLMANHMTITSAATRPAVRNMIRKADLPFDKETILAKILEKLEVR